MYDYVPPDRRRLIVGAKTRSKATKAARDLAPLLWSELSVLTVEDIQPIDPDDPLLEDWRPALGRPNQNPEDLTGPHWMTTLHTRGNPGTWWELDDA